MAATPAPPRLPHPSFWYSEFKLSLPHLHKDVGAHQANETAHLSTAGALDFNLVLCEVPGTISKAHQSRVFRKTACAVWMWLRLHRAGELKRRTGAGAPKTCKFISETWDGGNDSCSSHLPCDGLRMFKIHRQQSGSLILRKMVCSSVCSTLGAL